MSSGWVPKDNSTRLMPIADGFCGAEMVKDVDWCLLLGKDAGWASDA